MSQQRQALAFSQLHRKNNPVILYNIWDAGSALAVEQAGAKAIATGSWSCAAAQGYQDGEAMPFARLLQTVQRIACVVSLPLTVDFETGYGADRRDNLSALLQAGVVGIGLSDLTLIAELCEVSALPVNIMTSNLTPPLADLTAAGVSRISYGPHPYIGLMENLKQQARALY
ncbi:isocitrate lyase/phosphoenolpyruvate mutase family protein [Rahnella sp. C60]|uniref:isocitrate lyase/phosphoenolpyruvate mutase family protein n=1 Tax=Rahnella perminowiae TaxID=2816244 RepID=UPI001C264DD3|nr:isocitrate lyase/phosphoenolpyruvate mutase family protein [Rahnella perminowiae]MBU9810493.1 isocitrate lyase/phosphoenolpyruvate mutase family protein [Rahnella perminowiae]MBU9817338.1 isocitrate lyase/phosphoenolpyruvate mutase family protein [Rahnella perminowiae]